MKRIFRLLIVLLFFTTTGYAQVHNRTTGIDYSSISNALSAASNGHLIEVDTGTYVGSTNIPVNLSNFTNLTLRATAWTQSGDNTNTILDGQNNISPIIQIENGSQNKIIGFTIKKANHTGIRIAMSSVSNWIMNNHICSNDFYGVFINSDDADNNFILTNNIYGTNQNRGIRIMDGDNNIVRSNQVHNNQFYGIFCGGSAANNYVVRNTIYSNEAYGVYINSTNADNNFILANNIWGENQDGGINIDNGDNNIIHLNQIYNNQFYGIFINSNAVSNYVVRNTIYSNDSYGVYINSTNADNNFILTNNIWGENQTYGINIGNADNTIIRSNQIHNNEFDGIYIDGDAVNNYVIRNTIYSNERYGVFINSEGADNNFILTNTIWGENQDYGIRIDEGDNNKIHRNLIKNNESYGIYLNSTATNIEIINNTIYGSGNQDGIYLLNSSSGKILNNIIMSNGDGSGDFGIQVDASSTVYIAYNDIYGNHNGATNSGGGGMVWGAGNITNNPLIDTVNTFEITSAASPCVDSGTNIPGVSDNYNDNGPDMGWKEFFIDDTPPITTVSKDSGFYSEEIEVVFTATDPETPDNIQIYYTTDGIDPKTSSTVKNGLSPVTIKINTTTTLKFYAENSIGLAEEVQTRTYTFEKIPTEDVAVYNNYLDLSKAEPARIIFGKAGNVEIKIYNMKGVLVKSYVKQYYKRGEGKEWYGTVKKTAKKVGAGLYIVVIKGDINEKLKMIVKK